MRETFQSLMDAFRRIWAADKSSCFHCGDSMRRSRAVEVQFAGEERLVCCHGCAAALKTIEQMGMQQQYFEQKKANSQNEK